MDAETKPIIRDVLMYMDRVWANLPSEERSKFLDSNLVGRLERLADYIDYNLRATKGLKST